MALEKYIYNAIEYSPEQIKLPQIRFVDLIGTEVEPFIKEGSLKTISSTEEIYVKLPNWGDVKLSFYKQPITFSEEDKKIVIDFKYLITTLKVKVIEGDDSGYKKHYFVSLCWMQKELFTKPNDIVKTINLLLKNNTVKELKEDTNALCWDMFCGGGI